MTEAASACKQRMRAKYGLPEMQEDKLGNNVRIRLAKKMCYKSYEKWAAFVMMLRPPADRNMSDQQLP